jgi:hypothetical protein
MRRFFFWLICGWFTLSAYSSQAYVACRAITLPERVAVGTGAITLAALFPEQTCPELREAAAQITLGMAPQKGSARVFERAEIRQLIDGLGERAWGTTTTGLRANQNDLLHIPERIVVQRAGATKSCAEVTDLLAKAAATAALFARDERWQNELNCSGAGGVPESAALELLKTTSNPNLQRWEFCLRCVRAEDCSPFLVWLPIAAAQDGAPSSPAKLLRSNSNTTTPLVARGQTALLTWEQAGIRIVLPVTCLESGSAGQFVLVRFQNAVRMLQAEVTGAGTLRAGS